MPSDTRPDGTRALSRSTLVRMTRMLRAVPVLAVIALAACSTDEEASSTTAVVIRTTDFATIPPVETEPPGPTTIPDTLDVEQEYVIVAGDYPLGVAAKFGITLEELIAHNGWVDVQRDFPFPGRTIFIPAGAKNPAASAAAAPVVNDPGLLTVPPVETVAGGQDNSGAGTYIIESGDFPLRIAQRFDVTLEELAAANGWEDLQRDFPFPGTVIIIPPKSG